MLINKIEKKGKIKYLFYIDHKFEFFLTSTELREYKLFRLVDEVLEETDMKEDLSIELPDNTYNTLHDDVVLPRGKRYALDLLSDRDYTVNKLTRKLLENGYSEDDSQIVIDYIKSFKYLDDVRYAVNYIRSKEETKSTYYIQNQLLSRGVSSENIKRAFEMIEEEHEDFGITREDVLKKAIEKSVKKKLKPADFNNQDKITKVIQSLIREGYRYSDVKEFINNYIENYNND